MSIVNAHTGKGEIGHQYKKAMEREPRSCQDVAQTSVEFWVGPRSQASLYIFG